MKESVQKMNGRKKYKGEVYSFFRSERNIGSGGNGAVYDVEFEGNEGFEFPIVAKFFEYGGADKEKRYDIVNIGLHFFLKNVRPYAASCSEA